MRDSFEKKLNTLSQQTFDSQLDEIDDDILQRLKTSRLKAVASAHQSTQKQNNTVTVSFPTWLSSVSSATAFASIALVISSLWLHSDLTNQTELNASPLENIALLSSADELEFYENLDFYIWLEDEISKNSERQNSHVSNKG